MPDLEGGGGQGEWSITPSGAVPDPWTGGPRKRFQVFFRPEARNEYDPVWTVFIFQTKAVVKDILYIFCFFEKEAHEGESEGPCPGEQTLDIVVLMGRAGPALPLLALGAERIASNLSEPQIPPP